MNAVEIYCETKDFMEVVRRTGKPAFRVHIELLKAGVLQVKDKVKYGSKAQRLGGQAEELFQRLVPEAVDVNSFYRRNNPRYDFVYKGLKIDIKYAGLRAVKKDGWGNPTDWGFWGARLNDAADINIIFCEQKQGAELNGCYILVVPVAFVKCENFAVYQGSKRFKNFNVAQDELIEVLDAYAQASEGDGDKK